MKLFSIFLTAFLVGSVPTSQSIYSYDVTTIDGKTISMDTYKGEVLLIVNVASQCGYTPQYEGLQKLYEQYREKGFKVLGFPANNFGGQEPGSNGEIKAFCSKNFGVTFPMFSKISVKGNDMHPLYQYLSNKEQNGQVDGAPKWNFHKYLINREGTVVASFSSGVKPLSTELTAAIEKEL